MASLAAAAPAPVLWLREGRETLRLGWPLIAAQLATQALTLVDVVMMGWLGPAFLAGGALGAAAFFPLQMFGYGVVTATAPMAAQAVGARRARDVRRTIRQGLWLALALSALLIPLILQGERVFRAIGQPAESAALAGEYLAFAAWQLPAALGFIALRAFVAALGETRIVLLVTLAAIPLNAALNGLLMFGLLGFPRMELAGAGLATALVHTGMFAALFRYCLRRRRLRRYALAARFWRADWPRFFALIRLGAPIGLTMLAESGLFAAASALVGWIGADALAAHAVAIQITSLTFMIPYGLSQATTVRVGMAWGAADRAGARRAGFVALALTGGYMSAAAALLWLAPEALIAPFFDPAEPANAAASALAVSLLAVAAVFQLADGTQVAAAGALRGIGDTARPMTVALIGYWAVGVPTALLLGFPLGFGAPGVWAGLAAGLLFAAVALTRRFERLTRG